MSEIMVRYHYRQRWVGWLNRAAITIGRHIFFKDLDAGRDNTKDFYVPERLYRHELAHVRQYGRLRLFGQWWIAIPAFLVVYTCQWVAAGFRWRGIRYEVEARRAETSK